MKALVATIALLRPLILGHLALQVAQLVGEELD
jgi:hypothetical protein